MSMFRVGQKVVRVEGSRPPGWCGPQPIKGKVYTVGWVGIDGDDPLIDLVELPSPETDGFSRGYMAVCFRPVVERKTDISLFKAMLNPADQDVGASA